MTRSGPDLRWLWLGGAFALTGASQLATQLAVGRILGAGAFGEVATLFNLMNLIGVPLVAVQLTVTSLVATGGSVGPSLRRYTAWGLLAGAIGVLSAPLWSQALAVPSLTASRVAALFVPIAFVVAVTRGNTVGQSRTAALAGAMCIAAVVRLVGSVVAADIWGVPGASAAAVASEATLAVALLVAVRPRGADRGAVTARSAASATYAQVAMWIIVNVDLLWARRLLDGVDAGRYLLVGGVSVGLVSFGQAFLWHRASRATVAEEGLGIVWRSSAIVASLAVVAVPLAIVVLPRFLGPSFDDLGVLFALGAVWAVVASVVHTSTATQIIAGGHRLRRMVPMAAVALVVPPLAVTWFGASPVVLSLSALASTTVGAVVVMGPQLLRQRAHADDQPADRTAAGVT